MSRSRNKLGIAKGIIAVIIIVIAAVAIAGAYYSTVMNRSVTTSSPSSTSSPPVSSPQAKVTITYYDDLSQSEAQAFDSVIIPQFEKMYPNISVKLVDQGATNIVSSIQALEGGGDVGPVVIAEDNMIIGQLLYAGDLMNLTPYYSTVTPSQLIPSMTNLVNYEKQVYGGVYFIPFRGNIPLVWYNKTVFSELGISPPQNWSQLMADAMIIHQKTGTMPVMFQGHGGASTSTELYQWMVQAGGNPLLFNDSGDVYAFTFLDNLSQYMNPQYVHGYWGSYKGLVSGSYDILDYQWPYIYGVMSSEGVNLNNIGFYPGPAGPANSDHLVGGDVIAIPKGATHIHSLLLFVKFLLSYQVQRDIITILGEPAVNQQAYQNLPSNVSALFNAEEQAFQTAFFREPVPWINEWNTIADQAFVEIVVNHANPSQIPVILSHANEEMYQYLLTNYNSTVAQEYEQGVFHPLY